MCVCVCVVVTGCAVMSGDSSTLSWKVVETYGQSKSSDTSQTTVAGDGGPTKIIKVCFTSNSANLGKNFKLVRCHEGMTVRVSDITVLSFSLYCIVYIPKE